MPLMPTSWEFAVDATQSAAIDWFELRPEIICNGKTGGQAGSLGDCTQE